ncbi:hypothetical protein Dip510_002015 [Elusimicrobium posterum]|uniref:hypothetical protein n=1 Tax=Elusimicrobium posterum TaxID=3116653 RepID=UPI003C774537
MKTLFETVKSLNIYLKILLVFCLIGFCRDMYLFLFKAGDYYNGYRLFGGFALMYGGQIVFILFKDWRSALLSGTQCFFALFLYQDYTFLPVVQPAVRFLLSVFAPNDYSKLYFVQYVMVSLLFSMEVFKTYLLFYFLYDDVKEEDGDEKEVTEPA